MRRTHLLLLVVCTVAIAPGEAPAGSSSAASREFKANEEVARWMQDYDRVALAAWEQVEQEPQEVLDRLGAEWFCVRDRGKWQAVFGAYDAQADRFETVLHYVVTGQSAELAGQAVQEELLVRYARALYYSLADTPQALIDDEVAFNTYIRPVHLGIEAWLVPAQQEDGSLALGGEVLYRYDSSGAERTLDRVDLDAFSIIEPDTELELSVDRAGLDVPRASDLYFALAFSAYFKSIKLRSDCFVTSLIPVGGPDLVFKRLQRPGNACSRTTPRSRKP